MRYSPTHSLPSTDRGYRSTAILLRTRYELSGLSAYARASTTPCPVLTRPYTALYYQDEDLVIPAAPLSELTRYLSRYAHCPHVYLMVLSPPATPLRAPYAMSGTDFACCYAVSGTDLAYDATTVRYAMSGTDLAYHTTMRPDDTTLHYAMSSTKSAYGATDVRVWCYQAIRLAFLARLPLPQSLNSEVCSPTSLRAPYAMSGTDLAYAPMRVLRRVRAEPILAVSPMGRYNCALGNVAPYPSVLRANYDVSATVLWFFTMPWPCPTLLLCLVRYCASLFNYAVSATVLWLSYACLLCCTSAMVLCARYGMSGTDSGCAATRKVTLEQDFVLADTPRCVGSRLLSLGSRAYFPDKSTFRVQGLGSRSRHTYPGSRV
eukprot:3941765-Rhodomonas_salina.2